MFVFCEGDGAFRAEYDTQVTALTIFRVAYFRYPSLLIHTDNIHRADLKACTAFFTTGNLSYGHGLNSSYHPILIHLGIPINLLQIN